MLLLLQMCGAVDGGNAFLCSTWSPTLHFRWTGNVKEGWASHLVVLKEVNQKTAGNHGGVTQTVAEFSRTT